MTPLIAPSVTSYFLTFTEGFEGKVAHMYLDIKGLVTVGLGQLLPSAAFAANLPFLLKPSEEPATPQQIAAEWRLVSSLKSLAPRGASAFAPHTTLYLPPSAIEDTALSTLSLYAKALADNYFPSFSAYPPDAQLALLSMAWALGPYFPAKWPIFSQAIRSGDWLTASRECKISEEGNPGIRPRNAANRQLLENVAGVAAVQKGVEEGRLFYPLRILS